MEKINPPNQNFADKLFSGHNSIAFNLFIKEQNKEGFPAEDDYEYIKIEEPLN